MLNLTNAQSILENFVQKLFTNYRETLWNYMNPIAALQVAHISRALHTLGLASRYTIIHTLRLTINTQLIRRALLWMWSECNDTKIENRIFEAIEVSFNLSASSWREQFSASIQSFVVILLFIVQADVLIEIQHTQPSSLIDMVSVYEYQMLHTAQLTVIIHLVAINIFIDENGNSKNIATS